MYCMLSYDTVKQKIMGLMPLGMVMPEPSTEGAALRERCLEAFLAKPAVAALRLSPDFIFDVKSAITGVPDESVDFVMHMVLVHYSLPAEHIERRRQIVDETFRQFFGPTASGHGLVDEILPRGRGMLKIVPDVMLADGARLFCTDLYRSAIAHDGIRVLKTVDAKLPLARRLCQQTPLTDAMMTSSDADKGPINTLLSSVTAIQDLDRHKVAVGLAMKLIAQPWAMKFLKVLTRAWIDTMPTCAMQSNDAVFDAAVERLGSPDRSDEDIINAHFARAKSKRHLQVYQVVSDTSNALRAGLDMGQCTAAALEAIAIVEAQRGRFDQRMRLQRKAASPPGNSGGTAQSKPNANANAKPKDEVDPVWAWPVDKLAAWIEGPLAQQNATTLDRSKLAQGAQASRRRAAELARRARAAAEQTHPPSDAHADSSSSSKSDSDTDSDSDAEAEDPAMSEAEIGAVVHDALLTSARYFLDDVREMFARVKLGVPNSAGSKALGLLSSELQKLIASPAPWDESAACALFQRAEEATADARRAIKQAKVSAQVQRQFANRLNDAVNKEPLVFGKRTGGVIDCSVTEDDWSFVNANFHNQWLPQFDRILFDNELGQLGSDQALAYYVTGSSLSGYAFDVSVHLWRRRADSTQPPSADPEGLRAMDAEHWFDTHIPCCVLHVRRAKT